MIFLFLFQNWIVNWNACRIVRSIQCLCCKHQKSVVQAWNSFYCMSCWVIVLTHVVSFGSYGLNLGHVDINGKIAINWDFAVFIVLWCLSVFYFFNFIFSEYRFWWWKNVLTTVCFLTGTSWIMFILNRQSTIYFNSSDGDVTIRLELQMYCGFKQESLNTENNIGDLSLTVLIWFSSPRKQLW